MQVPEPLQSSINAMTKLNQNINIINQSNIPQIIPDQVNMLTNGNYQMNNSEQITNNTQNSSQNEHSKK